MEYLYAFLLFIGIVFLTTLLTAILKILIPIAYLALGYYLGIESIIMGIGASLGAVVNIGNVSHYMKTEGAMSSAPYYSKLGSYGLIIAFIVGLFFKDSSYVDSSSGNGWLIFLGISIAIIGIVNFFSKRKLDDFKSNVEYYEIVEKYDEDPKWATKLHFKNGNEGWNETIKGSFMAKDPKNDLTFVHYSKENAEKYASRMFKNAEQLNDDMPPSTLKYL
jgi:hypothetical protein